MRTESPSETQPPVATQQGGGTCQSWRQSISLSIYDHRPQVGLQRSLSDSPSPPLPPHSAVDFGSISLGNQVRREFFSPANLPPSESVFSGSFQNSLLVLIQGHHNFPPLSLDSYLYSVISLCLPMVYNNSCLLKTIFCVGVLCMTGAGRRESA